MWIHCYYCIFFATQFFDWKRWTVRCIHFIVQDFMSFSPEGFLFQRKNNNFYSSRAKLIFIKGKIDEFFIRKVDSKMRIITVIKSFFHDSHTILNWSYFQNHLYFQSHLSNFGMPGKSFWDERYIWITCLVLHIYQCSILGCLGISNLMGKE